MCGNKDQKGFSLLEVVIAMLVLSVGLLGVVSLFETGFKALRTADKQGTAVQLAKGKMEELRAGDPTLLTSGQDAPDGMVRDWTVERSVRDPKIWVVEVQVIWKYGRPRNQAVSVKSFIFH